MRVMLGAEACRLKEGGRGKKRAKKGEQGEQALLAGVVQRCSHHPAAMYKHMQILSRCTYNQINIVCLPTLALGARPWVRSLSGGLLALGLTPRCLADVMY